MSSLFTAFLPPARVVATSGIHMMQFTPHRSLQRLCKRCFGLSTATSKFHCSDRLFILHSRHPASCRSNLYAPKVHHLASLGQRNYITSAVKCKSPLSSERALRKKPASDQLVNDKTKFGNITAYAVAEELYMGYLKRAVMDQGLYIIRDLPSDAVDALYVRAKYTLDDEIREIFFFREGCAVFWNMPEVERREVLKFMQRYSDEPYPMHVVQRESDQMLFTFTNDQTTLVDDKFEIMSAEGDDTQQVLEKYAISNAMSQSVKLAVMEAMLGRFVAAIEHVTEDLRDGKKISMSRREVLRRTGELFALRHRINLSSDLLDTPDFYWDRASLEPLYQKAFNNLNIPRRTRVMNERLNHCCELTELLTTHLSDVHHTRLEWMIIILIMVEVVFEVIHHIERYATPPEPTNPHPPTSNASLS